MNQAYAQDSAAPAGTMTTAPATPATNSTTATTATTAQPTAAPGSVQAQPPMLQSFVPFILIFCVIYFLMIRPQQKKLKEEQDMLGKLQRGDEVYTKSGLMGTIRGLTDAVVTLEVSDGVKIKLLRSQVGGSTKELFKKAEKAT